MKKIMDKQIYKDVLGWGFGLWLFGYLLGIALFMVVPPAMLGWIITPIGILASLWILFKKIKSTSFQHYLSIAIGWSIIAVVFDYIFLVMFFHPTDGYYKLDVYLYYALTFILPLAVGWYKNKKSQGATAE